MGKDRFRLCHGHRARRRRRCQSRDRRRRLRRTARGRIDHRTGQLGSNGVWLQGHAGGCGYCRNRGPGLAGLAAYGVPELSMYLGKVIGCVVSSVKNELLEGKKLLLVRRLPNGPVVVAIDAVGAGAGETVYVCRGREASFAFKPEEVPTEATVVAIVDAIERQ